MESEHSRLFDALPGLVWTAKADGVPDFVNKAWRDYTGLTLEAVQASAWTATIHPDDLPAAVTAWSAAVADQATNRLELRMRRFDGLYRRFSVQARPMRNAAGEVTGWCGINTDIEDQKRAEAQLAAEKQLLELIARGMPLTVFLDELCIQVERLSPESLCSILFVDPDGHRFRVGAGPSLPGPYNAVLEGLKIDPTYGPCSLAVETRSTIIAADPPRDPRFSSSPWPGVVTGYGLASCWSAPIFSSRGEVLGIFAIYKREPTGPTTEEEELIDRFTKIAGVAIERTRSDTALQARETELRRTNHFLAGAQRLSKTGSFSIDAVSDEQFWSEENFRIWGFDPAVQPTMAMVAAAIHPEDRADTLAVFDAATRAEEDFEVFYRIVTPSGEVKHLHTVMEIIPEIPDRIVYLGSSQDVTESKVAEAALKAGEADLRRANEYLSAAQRLSKTGSFTWDPATGDQDWSEELYRIWGLEPDPHRSMSTLHAMVHPDDLPVIRAISDSAIAARRGYEISYRIVTPGGALKHLHTVRHPIADITDRLVYIGATQDVTASKVAEEALRASEADLVRANMYLTAAQQLSKTGSFTWGVETGTLDWSPESYRIWGIDPSLAPAMSMIFDGIHPDDRERITAGMSEATQAGADFEMFHRIITPDGVTKHVRSVATHIPETPDGPIYFGSIQDITESRVAEEALKASEAGLRRANQYLAGAQRLSKTGSFMWDVATDEQDWSEELYRIWELSPEDDRSVPVLHGSFVHPDDVASVEAIVNPALQAGTDYEISYRIVPPGGLTKHLHTVNERVKEITDRLVYVGATQDLTASRLNEEALRTSEAKLRRANRYLKAAQTLSRIGSYTWDTGTNELDWSDENYRIWEVDPAVTPTMDTVLTAIHPEDLQAVVKIIEDARRSGEDFDVVYRIVTPAGLKYLHTVSTRIPEITDRVVYIGSNQDITESRLAEAALKTSEASLTRANRYLEAAQSLSRIGSFTWDLESDELDWSDENYRIWGVDPGEPPTMEAILRGIHPEDFSRVAGVIADCKRTAADVDVFYRIVTPTGETKHVHTVGTRIPEVKERLLYLGSTQDVTASKMAEDELARANTYLTAAQRLSQTGSFTWDVHADEHNWSDVIYRVFGFEPGSKITMGMMMTAIHPDDLPGVEALIGGAQIGENFELVFRVINTSGETRYAHVVGHRIDQIPDRPVFMGALQDITARKLAEDDLNRAREELAHVSRVTALSTLTASIAHEVSQPLAGIITNSSTCLRMLSADPPNVAGALATAQRNLRDGNRASEVIKRLRALYARRPPSLERVDLQDTVQEVLALLASELQRRRVIVRTDFAAGLPAVAADRIQLQQVILNLVLNAADAMGEITGRPRDLRIVTRRDASDQVSVDVRDSGPGLGSVPAEKLFEAFHTTKPDGMGIGLSVSRSIIEAHGGRLSAASNEGEAGATFSFSIPCDTIPVANFGLRQA